MDAARLEEQRATKDHFFATDPHSPLSHDARHAFVGLHYFEPNPALILTLPVEPGDGAEIAMQTSDGQQRSYVRAGTVAFEISGAEAHLTLYSTGDPGYFVPFRDATSGKDTYGAGRYIDVESNADGTVTLDFNLAYNPYCAYDDAYSCPLPPFENWLQVSIEAGEKTYPKAT